VPRGEVGTAAAGPQGYKAKKARYRDSGRLAFSSAGRGVLGQPALPACKREVCLG